MIFDIAGLAEVKAGKARTYTPKLLGRVEFHPPYTAWTHTFQPVFGRKMAWAAEQKRPPITARTCRSWYGWWTFGRRRTR